MTPTLIFHLTKEAREHMVPDSIEFRKMTQEEFSEYSKPQLEDYARAIVKNYRRPIDRVRIEARKQTKQLLKNGVSTRGHFLFNIIEKKTCRTIGHIWYHVEQDRKRAFLYYIEIHKPFRGKGYGRKTLRLLERRLRLVGVKQLGLHVFGDNQIAINLYKTHGFRIASLNMQKGL